MEDLIQRIEFLTPDETETIVLTMKQNVNFAEVNTIMQQIQKHFPKNKVIAIPHTLELNSMDTEALIHYLQEGDKGSIVEE